jgi:hypothetical protein
MRYTLSSLKRKVKALEPLWNAENFLSLALAIAHEVEITPEQAQRAIIGTVKLKPTNAITTELVQEAIQYFRSNPDTTLDDLEQKFNCNRYKLYVNMKEMLCAK